MSESVNVEMEKFKDKVFYSIEEYYEWFDKLPIDKHSYNTHDSLTVASSKKKIKKELHYVFLEKRCKCNGLSKSGNHRPYTTKCEVVHKLRASPDGTFLYFDTALWEWNHNHSKKYEELQQEYRDMKKYKKKRSHDGNQQIPAPKNKRMRKEPLIELGKCDVGTQTIVSNLNMDYEIVFKRKDNNVKKNKVKLWLLDRFRLDADKPIDKKLINQLPDDDDTCKTSDVAVDKIVTTEQTDDDLSLSGEVITVSSSKLKNHESDQINLKRKNRTYNEMKIPVVKVLRLDMDGQDNGTELKITTRSDELFEEQNVNHQNNPVKLIDPITQDKPLDEKLMAQPPDADPSKKSDKNVEDPAASHQKDNVNIISSPEGDKPSDKLKNHDSGGDAAELKITSRSDEPFEEQNVNHQNNPVKLIDPITQDKPIVEKLMAQPPDADPSKTSDKTVEDPAASHQKDNVNIISSPEGDKPSDKLKNHDSGGDAAELKITSRSDEPFEEQNVNHQNNPVKTIDPITQDKPLDEKLMAQPPDADPSKKSDKNVEDPAASHQKDNVNIISSPEGDKPSDKLKNHDSGDDAAELKITTRSDELFEEQNVNHQNNPVKLIDPITQDKPIVEKLMAQPPDADPSKTSDKTVEDPAASHQKDNVNIISSPEGDKPSDKLKNHDSGGDAAELKITSRSDEPFEEQNVNHQNNPVKTIDPITQDKPLDEKLMAQPPDADPSKKSDKNVEDPAASHQKDNVNIISSPEGDKPSDKLKNHDSGDDAAELKITTRSDELFEEQNVNHQNNPVKLIDPITQDKPIVEKLMAQPPDADPSKTSDKNVEDPAASHQKDNVNIISSPEGDKPSDKLKNHDSRGDAAELKITSRSDEPFEEQNVNHQNNPVKTIDPITQDKPLDEKLMAQPPDDDDTCNTSDVTVDEIVKTKQTDVTVITPPDGDKSSDKLTSIHSTLTPKPQDVVPKKYKKKSYSHVERNTRSSSKKIVIK
ncbi:hypothetical protein HCN44_000849 [Aphidius gifuensis]|uniref:Uncharacterized protein n=1 Tax=Aphidius gifuensis TaxID=684658 RepID=A0A835CX51_APHGI|nr:uncharacterized protein LOC122861036 [Aphidius gifuensis]KAF7996170.1 hypothetical protein HCN44_000849 [Aphidius gifuensis]